MVRKCFRCKVKEVQIYPSGAKSYCGRCVRELAKQWYHKNKEKAREYYRENREEIIRKVKKKAVENNYAYHKTPEARKRMNIRSNTRYKYPLEGKTCQFCPNPAREHHHNTNPITIHEFNYICKGCHLEKDTIRREKIQNGKNKWNN